MLFTKLQNLFKRYNATRSKSQQLMSWEQKMKENKTWPQNYSEILRAKWFCCAFQLNLFQFTCKVVVIYESKFALGLSIIFKKSYGMQVTLCCFRMPMLKISDLLSFFICSTILILKRHDLPMNLELQLAEVDLYTRKDFKLSGIRP